MVLVQIQKTSIPRRGKINLLHKPFPPPILVATTTLQPPLYATTYHNNSPPTRMCIQLNIFCEDGAHTEHFQTITCPSSPPASPTDCPNFETESHTLWRCDRCESTKGLDEIHEYAKELKASSQRILAKRDRGEVTLTKEQEEKLVSSEKEALEILGRCLRRYEEAAARAESQAAAKREALAAWGQSWEVREEK